MRAVFVLFDSLNRHMLGAYGGTRIPTPNFDRLAKRSVTFDKHYVGSLPCMPARRDMLSGRLTFLHRSWGPLEPFDNAFPELLHQAGVYSHLITDHFHYWEDGGATYHNRYDTYEFVRGQEGDPWKAMVQPHWERLREMYHARQFTQDRREYFSQNIINREFIKDEKDFPSVQCFAHGFEFLERNKDADGWLLQIETFDPHEPFHAPARFKEPFDTGWTGPIRDWPRYGRVDELPEECEELRANYYAVVSMCDFLLGQLLDYFDTHDLWNDTALVVTTDHGFLLGEHDFWAKNRMNIYEEVAHIPLFLHDPRRAQNQLVFVAKIVHLVHINSLLSSHSFELCHNPRWRDCCYSSCLMIQAHHHQFSIYLQECLLNDEWRYAPPLPLISLFNKIFHNMFDTSIYIFSFSPGGTRTGHPCGALSLHERSETPQDPSGRSVTHVDNVDGAGAMIERDTRLYDLVADPGQETSLKNWR